MRDERLERQSQTRSYKHFLHDMCCVFLFHRFLVQFLSLFLLRMQTAHVDLQAAPMLGSMPPHHHWKILCLERARFLVHLLGDIFRDDNILAGTIPDQTAAKPQEFQWTFGNIICHVSLCCEHSVAWPGDWCPGGKLTVGTQIPWRSRHSPQLGAVCVKLWTKWQPYVMWWIGSGTLTKTGIHLQPRQSSWIKIKFKCCLFVCLICFCLIYCSVSLKTNSWIECIWNFWLNALYWQESDSVFDEESERRKALKALHLYHCCFWCQNRSLPGQTMLQLPLLWIAFPRDPRDADNGHQSTK